MFGGIEAVFVQIAQNRIVMWHPISTAFASHPWPAGLSRRARTCDTVPLCTIETECTLRRHRLPMLQTVLRPKVDDIVKALFYSTCILYYMCI